MVVSAMDKNEPGPCHHKGYILTYLKGLVWTQHLEEGEGCGKEKRENQGLWTLGGKKRWRVKKAL